MFLFHLGNHCWLSKAHFINSALWCDCLFSKLEDQEAPSIDQTVEALILSPILNISCSHDVQLSEPAKIRVPLTLNDGGIEPRTCMLVSWRYCTSVRVKNHKNRRISQMIWICLQSLKIEKWRLRKKFLPVIILFGCYAIVESAVQVISIDLLVCSKCSKYVEKDINDEYIL